MAEDVSDQIHVYEGPAIGMPTGRKVEQAEPGEYVFEVGPLTRSDEYMVRVSEQHFTRARQQDFVREPKDFVHKVTGERYRLVTANPVMSPDPSASGITTFYETDDGFLIWLRPVGADTRGTTVVQGTVWGVA